MKLVLAAPESGLPSALTALVAHWSAMHFFMNDVFAAPASGLPSLPTALLSQVSCAIAVPAAKAAITVARITRLSIFLSLPPLNIALESNSQQRDLTVSSRPDQGSVWWNDPDRAGCRSVEKLGNSAPIKL